MLMSACQYGQPSVVILTALSNALAQEPRAFICWCQPGLILTMFTILIYHVNICWLTLNMQCSWGWVFCRCLVISIKKYMTKGLGLHTYMTFQTPLQFILKGTLSSKCHNNPSNRCVYDSTVLDFMTIRLIAAETKNVFILLHNYTLKVAFSSLWWIACLKNPSQCCSLDLFCPTAEIIQHVLHGASILCYFHLTSSFLCE